MNKLDFDGRLLEGKNVEKKIRDIASEMDFDDTQDEYFYFTPEKRNYHKKKSFYSYDKNCN